MIDSRLVVRDAQNVLLALSADMGSTSRSRRMMISTDRLFAPDIAPLPGLGVAWRRDAGRAIQTTVLRDGSTARLVKRLARHLPADFFVDQLVQFGGLFPLLYAAERQGWVPLHAALVSAPAGGVLIAGGAGAGKSTLAVALSSQPGWRLLADNIALTDGAVALGVAEPVKLDAWSVRAAGGRGVEGGLGSADAGWGRREYAPPSTADPVAVSLIVLPRLGAVTQLTSVAPQRAAVRLSAGTMLAYETQTYLRYAATVASVDATAPAPGRDHRVMRLTGQAPAVALDVARGHPLDEAIDLIDRRLGDR